jgi:hypothetical protein
VSSAGLIRMDAFVWFPHAALVDHWLSSMLAVINVGCVAVDASSCCVNANDAEPANASSCCDQCWCKCCS